MIITREVLTIYFSCRIPSLPVRTCLDLHQDFPTFSVKQSNAVPHRDRLGSGDNLNCSMIKNQYHCSIRYRSGSTLPVHISHSSLLQSYNRFVPFGSTICDGSVDIPLFGIRERSVLYSKGQKCMFVLSFLTP